MLYIDKKWDDIITLKHLQNTCVTGSKSIVQFLLDNPPPPLSFSRFVSSHIKKHIKGMHFIVVIFMD
jgi:hypothetical protein